MSTSYTQWMLSLPIRWLTGNPVAAAYTQVFGTVTDNQCLRLNEAVKQGIVSVASDDALPYIAQERGLIQGPTETIDEFRARLLDVWRVWPFAGTAVGELLQLYYQGYTDGYLIQSNGLMQYLNNPISENSADFPADQINRLLCPTNLLIDSPDGYWFSMPVRSFLTPIPSSLWDYSATMSTGTGVQQTNRYIILFKSAPDVWPGGIPTETQLNIFRSIINTWGPARAIFEGIVVLNDQPAIGLDLILGTSTMTGTTYTSYLSNVY